MRSRRSLTPLFVALLLGNLPFLACDTVRDPSSSQSLQLEQTIEIQTAVRSFMRSVAHDVTNDGPTAWQKEFADDPAFFMVVDGHMAFPNRQAATQGIQNLPNFIKHIELGWGDDLRVDVLAPNLAVVATSYHEVQTDPQGHEIPENGFFTAVAECLNGRWQLRDVHWSDPVPPPSRVTSPTPTKVP